MTKQTILHTIETGGPGGAESVLLALATRIDTGRFRSLALLPHEGWLQRKLLEKGIPVFLAKSSTWYDPHLPRTMARLVRQEKVQLIHSHLADQNFYSCLVGCLMGSRTVVTYHGSPSWSKADKLRGAIKLWFVRRSADAVVVVSDYLKQSLRDLKFPPDRIVRIHNGVDMGRFSSLPAGRLRTELKCQNGTKLIGMVANLRESKGYEYFIQAARKVSDAMPEARFVAIGEMDERIATPLQDLIRQLSLQDRFSFLGFREDVPDILNDLDLFVLSSVSEGFSLATVEAMAAGKPVIVTRSGGPQEIVEDGRTGFLTPPSDPDAMAKKICELLANPERAAALAQMARTKVVNTFSLDKMVDEYERLYLLHLKGS
jgi:glycosyltransferase involved in cell wall biosynthesis